MSYATSVNGPVAVISPVHRSSRGLWGQRGVPHSGWINCGEEDLGPIKEQSPPFVCEMCQSEEIRYAHTMWHPECEMRLEVGCICAGHMSNDMAGARRREAGMKSRAAAKKREAKQAAARRVAEIMAEDTRRAAAQKAAATRRTTWLDGWQVSAKGNLFKRDGNACVTLMQRGSVWRFVVDGEFSGNYSTCEKAKQAALDHLEQMK